MKIILLLIMLISVFSKPALSQKNIKGLELEKTKHLSPEKRVEKYCAPIKSSKLCGKLINDPEYRKLWLRAMDKLNALSRATNRAIVKLKKSLEHHKKILAKYRKNAFKLESGEPVYPAEDGSFFKENREIVTDKYVFTSKGKRFETIKYRKYIEYISSKEKEFRELQKYEDSLKK